MSTNSSSNVMFSRGPDENPFSMYSTTNSAMLNKKSLDNRFRDGMHHLASSASLKSREQMDANNNRRSLTARGSSSSGYLSNVSAFVERPLSASAASSTASRSELKHYKHIIDPTDTSMDWHRVSMTREMHAPANSLLDEAKQRRLLNSAAAAGSGLQLDPRKQTGSHGVLRNVKGVVPRDQIDKRDSQEQVHPLTLQTMRRQDPIQAENNGMGPAKWSTSSSTVFTAKPLQTEDPRELITRESLFKSQRESMAFAGGYRENNISSMKAGDRHWEQGDLRSTYKTTISDASRDFKYFRTQQQSARNAQADMKLLEFNRRYDGGLTRTGYYTAGGMLKSSEAAGAPPTDANRIQDDPNKLNKTLLKTIKRHDPVEYDHMQRRDFMVSTTHAFHHNKTDSVRRSMAQTMDIADEYVKRQQLVQTLQERHKTEINAEKHNPMATGYGLNRVSGSQQLMREAAAEAEEPVLTKSIMKTSYLRPDVQQRRIEETRLGQLSPRAQAQLLTSQHRYERNFGPQLAPYLPENSRVQGAYQVHSTLTEDLEELKNMHPTVQKMLRAREPAVYTEAVPTYAHKKRSVLA